MKKRIWSLLLAAMLLLSVCGGAMAEENTRASYQSMLRSNPPTGGLSITLPDTETLTPTVNSYKIMDIGWDDATSTPTNYTWVAAVNTWFNGAGSAYKDKFGDANALKGTMEGEDDFYSALGRALREGNLITAVPFVKEADPSKTYNLTVGLGQYLVLVEGGIRVYSPSIAAVVPKYTPGTDGADGTWGVDVKHPTVKSSLPSLDKTINANETPTDGHDKDKNDTAAIGEAVTFDIYADIPEYPDNAINKTYIITDLMSDGLDFIGVSSIAVKGVDDNGGEFDLSLGAENQYTLETATRGFTATFDYNKISQYKKIHIQYEAALNAKAVVGGNGASDPITDNNNHVELQYSNNPYSTSTSEPLKDDVQVYTYGIKVLKYAPNSANADDKTNVLAGAKFELRTSEKEEDPAISFVKGTDGIYRPYQELVNPGTATTELEVDADGANKGRLTIEGLKEGTYYLFETQAPAGYTKMVGGAKVEITKDNLTPWQLSDGTAYVTVDVPNSQGPTLPSTGGMGTTLFTIIGIVLMAAVVVILVVMSRKKSKEAE